MAKQYGSRMDFEHYREYSYAVHLTQIFSRQTF